MEHSFTFSITPYKGFEKEVLRLFHQNRPETVTLEYMNWRYMWEQSFYPPLIFWVHDNNGNRVGMSSLIFRSYSVNGNPSFFAIRGDTSLNKEYRGQGLGKELFQFIKSYVEKESLPCCCSLSNKAAGRASLSAGFKEEDSLLQYVYLYNINDKLTEKIKVKLIANIIGKLFLLYVKLKLSLIFKSELEYELVKNFDESFSDFWKRVPKENCIFRDRSIETLKWRYTDHPHGNFFICKILHSDVLIGFIVFQVSKNSSSCIISDFIMSDNKYTKPAMNLFVKLIFQNYKPDSIRMVINEKHPYSKKFKNIGFIKRNKEGSLITYISKNSQIRLSNMWFVTWMDKDI